MKHNPGRKELRKGPPGISTKPEDKRPTASAVAKGHTLVESIAKPIQAKIHKDNPKNLSSKALERAKKKEQAKVKKTTRRTKRS